jgi:hypothetical protein
MKEGELNGHVVPCPYRRIIIRHYTISDMIREYNNSDTVIEEVS